MVTSVIFLTDSEILENVRGASDDDKEDSIDIERVVTQKKQKKTLKL